MKYTVRGAKAFMKPSAFKGVNKRVNFDMQTQRWPLRPKRDFQTAWAAPKLKKKKEKLKDTSF